jgi:hypothetical protein
LIFYFISESSSSNTFAIVASDPVAEKRRGQAAQKDLRGEAHSFRYSCSKNEHDHESRARFALEAIERTLRQSSGQSAYESFSAAG